LDTAKAYWRFRDACAKIDADRQPGRFRLKPAWLIASAAVLATAGLAYVTSQPQLRMTIEQQALPLHPKRSHQPAELPPDPPLVASSEASTAASAIQVPRVAGNSDLSLLIGPTEAELLSVEIHALFVLHQSRYCVNSGVTVRRAGSKVEVFGHVQSRDRRDRLRDLLEGIGRPGIMSVRLTDPTEVAERLQAAAEAPRELAVAAAPSTPPIERWLREKLKVGSGGSEREMFNLMNSVVLESESVSSEAWAIRNLAQQFPKSRMAQLSPVLIGELLQMVDDHTIALGNGLQMLEVRLHVVLGNATDVNIAALANWPKEPWQAGAVILQHRAESAVSILLDLFSVASNTPFQADPVNMSAGSEKLNSSAHQVRECLVGTRSLSASLRAASEEALQSRTHHQKR